MSLEYFFCLKIVILIQNMILFGDILEKVSFSFFISGGINFLEKSSNFLRKGVNLSISGKMTIGIRSNLVVSLKKK